MTVRRRLIFIALAIAIGGRLTVASPQRPTPTGQDAWSGWSTWIEAAFTHTPGVLDAAADAVAPRSGSQLLSALQDFRDAFVTRNGPGASASSTAILRRFGILDQAGYEHALKLAAFLSADVAMLHQTKDGYTLPPSGARVFRIDDGRNSGEMSGTVHWVFARSVLAALPPRSCDEYVRLWYRATTAFLQFWNDYAEGAPQVLRARQVCADDAVLAMYEGTLHENFAEPRIQLVAWPYPQTMRNPMSNGESISTAGGELSKAEDRFKEALAHDSSLAEARVRLGHVLGERGRPEEAVAALMQALSGPLPALFQFYAHIFLGREEYTLGHADLARTAYERALALYPGAQSARLGLSQIALDLGHQPEAVSPLDTLAGGGGEVDRRDPYWIYRQTHEPSHDALAAELRRATAALRDTALGTSGPDGRGSAR